MTHTCILIKTNPNIFLRIRSDKDLKKFEKTASIYKKTYKNEEQQQSFNVRMTKSKIKVRLDEHNIIQWKHKDFKTNKTQYYINYSFVIKRQVLKILTGM